MAQRHIRQSSHWKKRRSKRSSTAVLSFLKRFSSGGLIKNLLTLAVLAFVLGLLVLGILFAVYSRDVPDPGQLIDRNISQSTKIYDRTGEELLFEIHGDQKRTLKNLQEGYCSSEPDVVLDPEGIPRHAIEAIIATEDHKFCQHSGFSSKGLIRAVVFRGRRGGGSTLTQQLVKNAILSNEQTIARKIKELIISVAMERKLSKDQILEIYFNEIPYGSTNYGIESAAQAYFGKPVHELSVPESATLAALPKAPTTYLNNPERLRARRDFVLSEMRDLEFITEDEFETYVAMDTPVELRVTNIRAPHFVFYIKEQLEEAYGRQRVEEGGLKVITTLDFDKQEIAETVVREEVDRLGPSLRFSNAALVAIDPSNGHVLSMVGSKDYFDEEIDGSVNVATRLRQPGSSFKPIVFTAAFERGYTPNTILWDVATTFPTDVGPYAPNNYDLSERGPITVRQALQGSLNIPAVKLTYLTGVEYAFEFAKRLGYTQFRDLSNYGLSIVLGGAEVQLLEHTNAYATFANEGVHHAPVSILRVEDARGEVLEEWKEEPGEEVMDPNFARMITHVLSDNAARAYVFGTGSTLQLGNRPVAAKTGTTNDSRDAWLMGYTPQLAAGVWAGNNNNDAMAANAGGSTAAGPIWNRFMRESLAGEPVEVFSAPTIPITNKAIIDGVLPAEEVTIDRASGKLATDRTPEAYRETLRCIDFHSILHYVDVSDPLGPVPKRPEKDSQYATWEAAIEDWVNRQNAENPDEPQITRCEVPTEEDDVHVKANEPSISIEDVEIRDGRFLRVDVKASARRGVSRVEYRLNDRYIAQSTTSPFTLVFEAPPAIGSGQHSLTVTAFDDVGNASSDSKTVTLGESERVDAISILDPIDSQVIEKINENYSVQVQIRNPSRFSLVSVFARPRDNSSNPVVIGSVSAPDSPFVTIVWDLPDSGEWVLSAVGETPDGQLELTPGTIVVLREAPPSAEPPEVSEDGDEPPVNVVEDFDPFGFITSPETE